MLSNLNSFFKKSNFNDNNNLSQCHLSNSFNNFENYGDFEDSHNFDFIYNNFKDVITCYFEPSCISIDTNLELNFVINFASQYLSVHKDLLISLLSTIEDQLC